MASPARMVTKWVPAQCSAEPPGGPRGTRAATRDQAPLTLVASLEVEDRAGDVILASGWELAAFESNPVVLWAHHYGQPAIGRSLRTWIDGKSLMATVEFAPTAFAQEIRSLYASGFMRGVSVGFRALETEPRRTSNGRIGTLFRRQELLEISAAPVPLNADALAAPQPAPRLREGGADRDSSLQREEVVSALRGIRAIWRELASLASGTAPGPGDRSQALLNQ